MVIDDLRLSENLLVEFNDEGVVLKARDEVGRGKRFGMDGVIELSDSEADALAKGVFARQFEPESD
jgi:hypothetical protein